MSSIMTRVSIFDRISGKRLCFLENSYDIGYTLRLNGLSTACFSLPADDPKNAYCAPLNYAELWDDEDCAGLFRILPSVLTKSPSKREIVYECEHVLATLMDDVLFGFHTVGNLGVFTQQTIRYILDRQSVKRWSLSECEFSRQFQYNWENENLLTALFSVANPLGEDYIWRFDTSRMHNWQISLKKRDTRQKSELRYNKNMSGIVKTVDPTMLTTRLYLLGYGEGSNQLNVSSINGGRPYIDADTAPRYGIISKIAVDRRFHYKDSLLNYGKKMLEGLKKPQVSYRLDASEPIGACVGDNIRVIDDEDGISENMAVVTIEKKDITSQPSIKYDIASKQGDLAGSVAGLSDRQRIAELYAQGATGLDSRAFADNADEKNPAVLRFYLPAELVRINRLILNFKLTPFRGYSQGTSSGGQSSQTTFGGGGSTQSSSSGGGVTKSTGAGGASVQSSESVTLLPQNISPYESGVSGATHNHGLSGKLVTGVDFDSKKIRTMEFVPSGAHSHGAHNHNVTIGGHSHEMTIPAHTHSISIPAHDHGFSIPEHYHEMVYGIYQGKTATSATLRVDSAPAGKVEQGKDIDIIPWLSKDGEGRIRRGEWHTVEIIPDSLTRIEADIVSQIYVQSQGGGDF